MGKKGKGRRTSTMTSSGRKRKLFSSNPGPLFKPMKLPRRVIKLAIVSLTFWKMETLCLMKRVVV